MSVNTNTFYSEGILFKNNKTKCNDEEDVEMLIPAFRRSGDLVSESHSERTFHFKFYPRTILVIVFTLISLTLSITFYIYLYANTLYSEGMVVHIKYSHCVNNSCLLLRPVDKIFILQVSKSNYSGLDNVNCSSPLERIEREHDGLHYNFVIHLDMGLYIGSGFKCLVNCSDNALRIKVVSDENISLESILDREARITEIIEQGILCRKISENYTIFCSKDGIYFKCNHPIKLSFPTIQKRQHSHYNPSHEMRLMVDKDHKWLACEKEKIKSEVVTIESLPQDRCAPYECVNHISLDIVETDDLFCMGNWTCRNLAHTIEHTHDGFKYNFVIGTDHDLYVGLGFKCLPELKPSINILRIKVLIKTEYGFFSVWEWTKFAEIVEQGIVCGKVSPNYTVSVNCLNITDLQICNRCLNSFEDYQNSSKSIENLQTYSQMHLLNDTLDQGKIIQAHFKMICPRAQYKNESTETPNNHLLESSICHPLEIENSTSYETTKHIEISSIEEPAGNMLERTRIYKFYFNVTVPSVDKIESDEPYDEDYVFNYNNYVD